MPERTADLRGEGLEAAVGLDVEQGDLAAAGFAAPAVDGDVGGRAGAGQDQVDLVAVEEGLALAGALEVEGDGDAVVVLEGEPGGLVVLAGGGAEGADQAGAGDVEAAQAGGGVAGGGLVGAADDELAAGGGGAEGVQEQVADVDGLGAEGAGRRGDAGGEGEQRRPEPNVGSRAPLRPKAATAICGEPPASVVPTARISPVGRVTIASAASWPPKSAVAMPALPNVASREPSGLTRATPKWPAAEVLATRILPSDCTATPVT